jgi:hypothetical protein
MEVTLDENEKAVCPISGALRHVCMLRRSMFH